jgi:hypothetical protein
MSKKPWEPIDWGLPTTRPDLKRRESTRISASRVYDWGNRIAWLLVALIAPFLLYAAIVADPSARLAAQEQRRQEVERENAAFCEKYGMPVGTAQHDRCAADLMEIRAREDERTAAEVRDLF